MDNSKELVEGAEATLTALKQIDEIKLAKQVAAYHKKCERALNRLVVVNALSSFFLCVLLWVALVHILFVGPIPPGVFEWTCIAALGLSTGSLTSMFWMRGYVPC